MPRNGAGDANPPGGSTAVPLTTISSSTQNALVADIYAEISASLPVAGTKAMAGNLSMGTSYKITNMATASDSGDAVNYALLQSYAQPLDADLIAIAALAAPGADRILFWDHSALTWKHLIVGSNLSVSDVTLNASGGAGSTNWGLIGGTITDQTDLTSALAGKQTTNANLTALATAFSAASASGPATLAFAEDTDNGSNKLTITAPSSVASDKTITLQDVTGTVYVSGGTDVAIVDGGTGASTAAAGFDLLKQDATTAYTGVCEMASAAEYRANTSTANLALSPAQVWSAAQEVSLSDGASIAVDWSSGINFTVTLGGNRTLANGTNEKPGQSGYIRVVQDGTGSRTLAYGTDYEFVGGSAPVLSTAIAAEDLLFYTIISSTRVFISLAKGIA